MKKPAKKPSAKKSTKGANAKKPTAKKPKKPKKRAPKKPKAPKKPGRANATPPRKPAKASPTRRHDADVEPFAVTASDIEALDSFQFRRFLRDLLRNEIDAYGGSPGDLVDNPGDGTDDGQDFLTRRTTPILGPGDDFIPLDETVWQIKAEKQTPSGTELQEEVRKDRPVAVLGGGGSYRFVAQQPGENENVIDAKLKNAVKPKHRRRVAFLARGALAQRARRFPSLARQRFFNRPLDLLHPYEWWSEKHRSPPFDEKARASELATVHSFLSDAQRPAHLRVVGPAGVGKTRLVLEALHRARLEPFVVYAENAASGQFSALFDWMATHKMRAVLVVDECGESGAQQLRARATEHALPIILVSIGRIEDGGLRAMPPDLRVHVQRMSDTDVVRILRSIVTLDDPVLGQIARATGGFVKLAKVVVEGIAANPNLAPEPGNTITIDIVDDVLKKLPGLSENAHEWLSVLALFNDVRTESSDGPSELEIIANFASAEAGDVSPWIEAAATAEVLSDKGDRIFVTPTLLAVHLARGAIRRRKRGLTKWLSGVPQRLQEACATQMAQLRFTEEGKALANELLASDGPFGNLLSVRQRWADNVFLALGSIAKDAALHQLRAAIGTSQEDEIRIAQSDPLSHLLFRLLWPPEHFSAAFNLVLRVLDAVGERGGERLQRLVSASLQVGLAINRLPFLSRLAIARGEFETGGHIPFVRGLIVRGVAGGVGARSGEGYSDVDIEEDGRDHWLPSTRQEEIECARAAAAFVVDALGDAEVSARTEAAAGLIDNAASLIRDGAHAEVLGAVSTALVIDQRVGKVREELERVLAFDSVATDAEKAVRGAIRALPQDLESQIRMLVEGWPLVEDRDEHGLDPRPDPGEVARQIVQSEDRRRIIALLFESWAENTYDLFNALARSDRAFDVWGDVLDAGRAANKTWGPSVFLASSREASNSALAAVPTTLLGSSDLFDRLVGAEALTKSDDTVDELRALTAAVTDGRIPPSALRYGIFGRWAERQDRQALAELIRAAASVDGDKSAAVALAHAAQQNLAMSNDEQADLVVSSMLDVQGHDAYKWEQLANRVAVQVPQRLARSMIERLRSWRKTQSRYNSERWADTAAARVLEKCIAQEQALAVEVLGLWEVMPYFVEHKLFTTIVDPLDVDTLVTWAADERRQQALARIVRPGNSERTDELLVRFGANSAFAQSLRRALVPQSWNGSLAAVLEGRATMSLEWAKDASRSETFRRWALDSARWLQQVAAQQMKSEMGDDG